MKKWPEFGLTKLPVESRTDEKDSRRPDEEVRLAVPAMFKARMQPGVAGVSANLKIILQRESRVGVIRWNDGLVIVSRPFHFHHLPNFGLIDMPVTQAQPGYSGQGGFGNARDDRNWFTALK